MAPAFANTKIVSACVSNKIYVVVSRRGYAAAVQGSFPSTLKTGSLNMILKKGSKESVKSSWAPEPDIGYYRPEGKAKEIDVAELREMLMKNKTKSQ